MGTIDSGSRRAPAGPRYYTNIPPGRYTFRVQASNSDGVWGAEGTPFVFSVAPHFYQSWIFYGFCLALMLAAARAAYAWRLRQLRGHQAELLVLVEQRTQELRAAKNVAERASHAKGSSSRT